MSLPPVFVEFLGMVGGFQTAVAGVKAGLHEVESAGGNDVAQATGLGTKAMLGLGVAAVAAGAKAVDMAANFQQQMVRLTTAAGESSGNLKMVSDGVLQIAASTGTSTKDLAAGMYMVESAGFHGTDALTVMKAAAQGAKIENADLGTVSNALTTAMKDMHAPASSAATVMSQMVSAVGQGKMTMDDLAGALHSVLPNASALGISFPQVAGALATMTAQGVSADQAADNLNHTIVKLAAPTASMTQQMASYGLNAADVAKQLGSKGLTGTMSELVDAITSHMGPAGTTLRSAFNQSQAAAADANRMLQQMPASIQGIAEKFASGQITLAQWRTALKGMPADQAALAQQFATTSNAANGFSAQLKAGGQDSQTFTAALKGMLGDQTGLQVALHLTGGAAGDFATNVKVIGKASGDSKGNVQDWATVQKNLTLQLAQAREQVEVLGIRIGTALMPAAQALLRDFLMPAAKFLASNASLVEHLGIAVAGVALAIGLWKAVTAAAEVVQTVWNAGVALGVAVQEGYKVAMGISTAMTLAVTGWVFAGVARRVRR